MDVRDIFGEQYAFRAGTVGTADWTAYGFVSVTNVTTISLLVMLNDRLAMGAAKRNTGQHPGGIVNSNYKDVYDFTPFIRLMM